MTMDDENDDAKYAALEAELSEPAEQAWTDNYGADDDSSGGEAPIGARERDDNGDDGTYDEAAERAALQADEWEAQQYERTQHGQQQQNPTSIYDDPIGFVQRLEQQFASQVQRQNMEQIYKDVEFGESQFAQQNPDYRQATEFLEQARAGELKRFYPDSSPQAHLAARKQGFQTPAQLRDAILKNEALGVIQHARSIGVNPAEVYYGLAQERGFQARGGRSSGRSSGGRASGGSKSTARLLDLYAEDGDAFDREWDKMAKAGAL